MKICLFADAQSMHIQQLVPGLLARGLEVHVLTHKPAKLPGATVERFCVPSASLANPRRWNGRRAAYLRGFLRRFDVVNIHFLTDWGFQLQDGLPDDLEVFHDGCVIVTAWGSDVSDPPGETPASTDLIRKRVAMLRSAAAVTTCGPTFAEIVARYAGIDREDVHVVPFGVNTELFRPSDHQRRGPDHTPRVGFYKGFREVYGAEYLIRAIPGVLAEIPEARFELIGDGPCLERCQTIARSIGVESSVDWLGRQRHDALGRILDRWDVSVIPSIHEAFGVAALESSSAGVPVVASNVEGLRDTVLDGETGLLVEPKNSDALTDAIVALLRDDEMCVGMGRAGRAMVERAYDWRDVHTQWVRLYERVLETSAVMV